MNDTTTIQADLQNSVTIIPPANKADGDSFTSWANDLKLVTVTTIMLAVQSKQNWLIL